MKPVHLVPALATLLLLAGTASAFKDADKIRDQAAARAAVLRGEIMPVIRILNLAQRIAPGEVIEVELERRKDGSFKYEVKTLAKSGRVREVKLDARTGALIKVEDD